MGFTAAEVVGQDEAAQFQLGGVAITWRGDGLYFATVSCDSQGEGASESHRVGKASSKEGSPSCGRSSES